MWKSSRCEYFCKPLYMCLSKGCSGLQNIPHRFSFHCFFSISISVLTLSGGSRWVWGTCAAEKASVLSAAHGLWIYLHLRSDYFRGCEGDVFCSAGCKKNTAIVLNSYILLFTPIRQMVRFRLFPLFHHFSSSLPDWSADSGFYLPPPCRNNSSLVALHLRIYPASSSTASCHPSPTNFPITTCDSGGELLSLLLLNLPVSCGIILKRTLLFKTHFATLLVKSALAEEERSWFSWSIV